MSAAHHANPIQVKVWVFGADVSEFATNVNWSLSDKNRGPSTATITLNNANDVFIHTLPDQVQLVAGYSKFTSKGLKIKEAVLSAKQATAAVDPLEISSKIDTTHKKYSMFLGLPIFSTNDPVYIAARDPYTKEWHWVFSGFVTSRASSQTKNESTITLTCAGPSYFLNIARISTNPGVFDAGLVIRKDIDLAFRAWYKEFAYNFNFYEAVRMLLFGSFASNVDYVTQTHYSVSAPKGVDHAVAYLGISNFTPENAQIRIVQQLGNQATQGAAEAQYYTSFTQAQREHNLAINNHISNSGNRWTLPSKTQELLDEELLNFIGSQPETYLPTGRLLMLLPEEAGIRGQGGVFSKTLGQGPATQTEFSTRAQLIYDWCERLDFRIWDSPLGDLVIEMPNYDIDPPDIGVASIEDLGTHLVFQDQSQVSRYDLSLNESAVVTGVFMNASVAQGLDLGTQVEITGKPTIRWAPGLIGEYGVRMRQLDVSNIYVAGEAAERYAEIQLARAIREPFEQKVDVLPNLRWIPNRPLEFRFKHTTASLRTLQYTASPNSLTCSLDLDSVRFWDGLSYYDAAGSSWPLYAPIGGVRGAPPPYHIFLKPLPIVESLAPPIPVAAIRESGGNILTTVPLGSDYRTTSTFGPRMSPTLGASSDHKGIDLAAPNGTPVLAAGAGRVLHIMSSNSGYGNRVEIDHGSGVITLYAHLGTIAVSEGQQIPAGTPIGTVGSTGTSTGNHLHFEVRRNGVQENPRNLLPYL